MSDSPLYDFPDSLDSEELREYPIIQARREKKPWEKVCCKACWFAVGKECVCKCGGRYHGKGIQRSLIDHEDYHVLSEDQAKPFWEQMRVSRCKYCENDLTGLPIQYFNSINAYRAGWIVEGLPHKVWLFIVCPNCKYQWALWKLGVSRK